MNRKITVQQNEKILSKITGLIDGFDGIQHVYFGDLYSTNKRLYVISNKLINMEVSLWFEGERIETHRSTFIVGEHRITVRWIYMGNFLDFIETFHQLSINI